VERRSSREKKQREKPGAAVPGGAVLGGGGRAGLNCEERKERAVGVSWRGIARRSSTEATAANPNRKRKKRAR
jgi:hypothetical protein